MIMLKLIKLIPPKHCVHHKNKEFITVFDAFIDN